MRRFSQMISFTLMAVFLLSGLLLAGCEKKQQPAHAPAQRVRQVSTVTVQTEKIVLTTELPGRTSAYRVAEIRPQVSGLLTKRLFTEGADVVEGQPLYQIDPAPFQVAVDNAVANLAVAKNNADRTRAALKASEAEVARLQVTLELARTNRERYEASFKEKIVSTIQRDQAVTDVKVTEAAIQAAEAQVISSKTAIAAAEAAILQAEAALKASRINLGYTKITAPISGRIGRSNVTEGAMVTGYQPLALAVIQQNDPIYVDVPQSTADMLRLKRSMKEGHIDQGGKDRENVKLFFEDGSAYPVDGKLQFSEISVDPTTGSVIFRAEFPNSDGLLLPGMFVRAQIMEGVNENAILVPQQGVSRDHRGNPYSLIVDAESKAGIRMLKLNRAIGDRWLVSSGLAPGDRVIVEGLQMLRPGMAVKEVPSNKEPKKQVPAGSGKAPAKQSEGGA